MGTEIKKLQGCKKLKFKFKQNNIALQIYLERDKLNNIYNLVLNKFVQNLFSKNGI